MSLIEEFRHTIATESETGMMIAADALEDSADARNNKMGELLRLYCDIQTYVRTSQSIPLEMGFRFEELNKFFGSDDRRYVPGINAHYHKPLGQFYTALSIRWDDLTDRIHLLSDEPVRYLQVTGITNLAGVDLLLRNYRIDSMFEIEFQFGYRHGIQAATFAQALTGMKASSLRKLTVRGLADRTKAVELAFRMAKGIPKGCALYRTQSSYDMPNLIRVKK